MVRVGVVREVIRGEGGRGEGRGAVCQEREEVGRQRLVQVVHGVGMGGVEAESNFEITLQREEVESNVEVILQREGAESNVVTLQRE